MRLSATCLLQTDDHQPRRRGQVLVEFALIALALYLVLAATIEMGRALHSAQGIQGAVDVAARELSRTPLPPNMKLQDALNDPTVRATVFDDRMLVIDVDQQTGTGMIDDLFAQMPVVNQSLRAVMIFEVVNGRRLLHYPGALLKPGDESTLPPLPSYFMDSGLRIGIPLVVARDSTTGKETQIQWVDVIEEILPSGATTSPFQITSPQRGLVGLRINYPYQAATLSGYTQGPDGPFEPGGKRIQADDSTISAPAPLHGRSYYVGANPNTADPNNNTPYAGQYGLGQQQAFLKTLRPFRKLLSAQAIYRREVFQ